MSALGAVMRELMACGLAGEDLIAAVERVQSAMGGDPVAEKRRAYDRERKRRQREAVSGGSPVEPADAADNPQKKKVPDLQKENTHPPSPPKGAHGSRRKSADDLAGELWAMQPTVGGKRRASKPDVAKALPAALSRGAEPDELRAAFRAYYALPDCRKEGGQFAMSAKRLLELDRWREFLPVSITTVSANWTGPPEIRARIVMEANDAFARSYLDPAEWIAPNTIKPANGYAASKLRPMRALKDLIVLEPEARTG